MEAKLFQVSVIDRGVIIPALMHWIQSEIRSELCFGESSTRISDLGSPHVTLPFMVVSSSHDTIKKMSYLDHSSLPLNGLNRASCCPVILLRIFYLLAVKKLSAPVGICFRSFL